MKLEKRTNDFWRVFLRVFCWKKEKNERFSSDYFSYLLRRHQLRRLYIYFFHNEYFSKQNPIAFTYYPKVVFHIKIIVLLIAFQFYLSFQILFEPLYIFLFLRQHILREKKREGDVRNGRSGRGINRKNGLVCHFKNGLSKIVRK